MVLVADDDRVSASEHSGGFDFGFAGDELLGDGVEYLLDTCTERKSLPSVLAQVDERGKRGRTETVLRAHLNDLDLALLDDLLHPRLLPLLLLPLRRRVRFPLVSQTLVMAQPSTPSARRQAREAHEPARSGTEGERRGRRRAYELSGVVRVMDGGRTGCERGEVRSGDV